MARRKPSTRDITKQIQKIAEDVQNDIEKVVADKLLETYKTNVALSYSPKRNVSGESETANPYRHTGTFLDSIKVRVDRENATSIIAIEIEDKPYAQLIPKTTEQVYTFLTEGTVGGGYYPYLDGQSKLQWSYNHPMPAHLFELHTVTQMEGFLDSLDIPHYSITAKRYKIKKGR